MATAVLNHASEAPTEEQLATRYAGEIIYRSLLDGGEPLKASEVAKLADRQDVDVKLARVVLTTHPGMTAVDRKWTIWTRYLDTRTTVDQNLRRILNTYGAPITLNNLARELTSIYGRPAEIYEEMLEHVTSDRTRFFRIGEYVALAEWLLDTSWEDEADVLYENYIADSEVFPFESALSKMDPNSAASIAEGLDAVDRPLKALALQFFAWRKDRAKFDPATFYARLFSETGAQPVGGGEYIGPALAQRLASHFQRLAEQEVSENAETEVQEAAQPLVVKENEVDNIVKIISDSDGTVYASNLIEDVFEITTDYRTYEEDLNTLIRTLASDDRIVWVGADRFRPQGTIPPYVFSVPGLLEIPTTNFLDPEGLPIDLLLEDEGFEGGLDREIVNPLAQDVLDEEPIPRPDPNPPSTARAVIKYHHKEIGTLPLCQFPSGFFPAEPKILETEFTLPAGQKAQVWVNNETRLIYGLIDWFESIPIDSGATFTLERNALDQFAINYNEESEPSMFISRNRINELMALQARAEAEDLSNFEVIREIMEHYRKGIEYLTLLTEVNIVRRVTRRMVASVLSEYHCYFQRAGAWVFDTKKLIQGFDKSKRKFLVKTPPPPAP